MGQQGEGKVADAVALGEAYAAARELLQRAEEDASRIRAEADRYVQRRHQEAELVVAKARRVLEIAEERAAAMDAGAFRLPPVAPDTIDLTQALPASEGPQPVPASRLGGATALDSILAGAVSRAIERALPSDG